LKIAMIKASILALPNFLEYFIIETDALGTSIGEILIQ